MTIIHGRKYSEKELLLRDLHRKLRELRHTCLQIGLTLLPYNKACNTDRCVLSSCEYDFGEQKDNCDPEAESYFLNEREFTILTENTADDELVSD